MEELKAQVYNVTNRTLKQKTQNNNKQHDGQRNIGKPFPIGVVTV